MSDNLDKSAEANQLRKSGDFKAAIKIYRELWAIEENKFTGAGLLHCLRKEQKYNEALELSSEIYSKFPDFDWCRNECIWTNISAKLFNLPENIDTLSVVNIANSILEMKPEIIAYNFVVFKVIKTAKRNRDWVLMNDWLIKIDSEELKSESEIKGNWTDRELWYYYKAVGLVAVGDFEKGLEFIENVKGEFRSKSKFFDRLSAKAQIARQNFEGGEEIYKKLTRNDRVDWWILQEYGKLLIKNGKAVEGFKMLLRAAIAPGPLINKISLFSDLANEFEKQNKLKESFFHLHLVKLIREENGWFVSDELIKRTDNLRATTGHATVSNRIKDIFKMCKEIWSELGVRKTVNKSRKSINSKMLRGFVKLGDPTKPFCFIKSGKESFFCSKSELPKSINEGQQINFQLVKAFDKKKNKESVKATNVSVVKD
ncbi:hypothetical protein [Maribacter sp. MAR_2009_72]|uniref:hypothetical protein n=1 Tax=Maribacter sp. MAR_2009_72 TaxID=1250050 RepID=UPI00119AA736|nr:hypothetical protein [Maribacter sp. MAR_2009_72]TVZ14343.1 hypothetical protein JM81_0546 [Maribacter sp. MAR_2009_72]